jgi:hypothetical protein
MDGMDGIESIIYHFTEMYHSVGKYDIKWFVSISFMMIYFLRNNLQIKHLVFKYTARLSLSKEEQIKTDWNKPNLQ